MSFGKGLQYQAGIIKRFETQSLDSDSARSSSFFLTASATSCFSLSSSSTSSFLKRFSQ